MRQKILYILLMITTAMSWSLEAEAIDDVDSIDINNPREDFVTASLIIAEPGDVLYSCVGHACLRMQCPAHNLDYIYSYESEEVKGKVITFLAGKLRMGMTAIPTTEYLAQYKTEHRGVRQYDFNLPIATKQRLWEILDNHIMEGMNLKYDYISRGCAHSTLCMIKDAMDTIPIRFGEWPEKYKLTRREITSLQLKNDPWTWLFLNILTNGSINSECSNEEKIIMPVDLLETLQHAKIENQPLLSSHAIELLPSGPERKAHWCSPLLVSILILFFTIVCVVFKKKYADYLLLIIQSAIGFLTTYLVFFSDLVCTEWSWQIVPFNPLPLFLWRWRLKWSLAYTIIITLWIIAMCFAPHCLTDTPLIILSVSLVLSYIGIINRKGQLELNLWK